MFADFGIQMLKSHLVEIKKEFYKPIKLFTLFSFWKDFDPCNHRKWEEIGWKECLYKKMLRHVF